MKRTLTLIVVLAMSLTMLVLPVSATTLSTMAGNKAAGGPYLEYTDPENVIAALSGTTGTLAVENGYVRWERMEDDWNCARSWWEPPCEQVFVSELLIPVRAVNPLNTLACYHLGLFLNGESSWGSNPTLPPNSDQVTWVVVESSRGPGPTGYARIHPAFFCAGTNQQWETGWEYLGLPSTMERKREQACRAIDTGVNVTATYDRNALTCTVVSTATTLESSTKQANHPRAAKAVIRVTTTSNTVTTTQLYRWEGYPSAQALSWVAYSDPVDTTLVEASECLAHPGKTC
jgi:hypothetical protein